MQLWNDYFSEDATYPSHMFRRRFRMNKPLFMRIVDALSAEIPYFQQRRDATGRFGHSSLQKATAAIRMMAYGCTADAVDEYLRLGRAPKVNYIVNGHEYHLAYYLTDGIYPKWATFVQSIPLPQGQKASLFATQQEAVRKDVERAFGEAVAMVKEVEDPEDSAKKLVAEAIKRVSKDNITCVIVRFLDTASSSHVSSSSSNKMLPLGDLKISSNETKQVQIDAEN
ncbi:uncharacterized protein LOC106413070 [Brassica napus]|uniref:uncharacterized protein LOC106413070 n=1 Tax=Brassica napus TaxID=3708 RepID=UPI00207A65C9|nr:uncharacterized protein LOC106413070 [Brassica napus]